MTPKLKELCEKLIVARNKATPGEWDNRCKEFSNSEIARHIWTNYGWIATFNSPLNSTIADAEFTGLSANNIIKLAKASLIMAEALEHYSASYMQSVKSGDELAKQTLQKVEEVLSES
jgi:hypothetical protein